MSDPSTSTQDDSSPSDAPVDLGDYTYSTQDTGGNESGDFE